MTVTVADQLAGPLADEAWALYHAAFEELNALAVARHLMYRKEFDEVCADRRVAKYLSIGDAPQGLATFTNQLDAMPLISPAYFQRRWPQHYAEQRIWYCGFVAVAPGSGGVFAELVEAMYRRAETERGVIGLDICRHNDDVRRLPRAIALMLHRISGGRVRAEEADAQTFYTYETAP